MQLNEFRGLTPGNHPSRQVELNQRRGDVVGQEIGDKQSQDKDHPKDAQGVTLQLCGSGHQLIVGDNRPEANGILVKMSMGQKGVPTKDFTAAKKGIFMSQFPPPIGCIETKDLISLPVLLGKNLQRMSGFILQNQKTGGAYLKLQEVLGNLSQGHAGQEQSGKIITKVVVFGIGQKDDRLSIFLQRRILENEHLIGSGHGLLKKGGIPVTDFSLDRPALLDPHLLKTIRPDITDHRQIVLERGEMGNQTQFTVMIKIIIHQRLISYLLYEISMVAKITLNMICAVLNYKLQLFLFSFF